MDQLDLWLRFDTPEFTALCFKLSWPLSLLVYLFSKNLVLWSYVYPQLLLERMAGLLIMSGMKPAVRWAIQHPEEWILFKSN